MAGLAIAVLALGRVLKLLTVPWLSYVNAAIALWVAASAVALHERPILTYVVLILGVLIFLLAVFSSAASARGGHPGG